MDAIRGHHVKRNKPGSETQRLRVFSHTWKIDPKINIYKNKHDHIQTHVEHVCNSGTDLWNLGKDGKEKRMIERQQCRKT
jgi:hypothetical protein